ncbi:MAG: Flp family type IVb pilin [Alphaproteobacteria bacterium]|uniref:Flp family type IVb pilin n=1 Tax=Maricaulis alexandrii TaxID=2570354 RepID=UPI0011084EC1|nr:Flp family type IVb pilin [Maricaulis alexandrii]MCR9268332.1 Flp family type IVb pilin [Alphaproteobacteria bacterium]
MMGLLNTFARDERGATAIEYAMIGVIVSIAAIAGLSIIGPAVMGMFNEAGSAF